MFFSANLDYPKKLQAAGLIENSSYYQYAKGKIVVWVPNDSKINLSSARKALTDLNVKKIAIANPLHAPYGTGSCLGNAEGRHLRQCKRQIRSGREYLANGIVPRLGFG
jgi:hypothetical protein